MARFRPVPVNSGVRPQMQRLTKIEDLFQVPERGLVELAQLSEGALVRVAPMAEQGWAPARSILRQLEGCLDLSKGEDTEQAPGPFSMGLIATHEFAMDGDQPELAALVNRIQWEVERAV